MRYTIGLNNCASLLMRSAALCICSVVLALFGYSHVQAANIAVDGGCSLADAITSANTDSGVASCTPGNGADTVILSDTLYSLTTADNNYLGDNNALPAITSTMTISSIPGVVATLLRGPTECPTVAPAQTFRFFVVDSNGDLTLNDMSLDNGCAPYGGAIYNAGGRLTLVNTTLFENKADFNGGGIYSPDGVVNITGGSLFQSNKANQNGGGLFLTQGRVEDSVFYRNYAVGEGGAIFANGLIDKYLVANDFIENRADLAAPALYLFSAKVHIDNNLLASNVITSAVPADISLGAVVNPSTLFGQHNTMVATSQPANAIVAGQEIAGDQVFVTDTIFSGYDVALTAHEGSAIVARGVLWDNTTVPTQSVAGGVIEVSNAYSGSAAFSTSTPDDYHLTAASLAINHGVSNLPPTDIDGEGRPIGLESDLGYDEFAPTISINISKTVGTDANSCGSRHQLTVQSGTAVYYCFTLQNTSNITFTQHTLTDALLGVDSTLTFDLGPTQTVQITRSMISALGPVTATESLTNTASVSSTDLASAEEVSAQSVTQFGTPATDTDTAVVKVDGFVPTVTIEVSKTVGTDANGCASTDSLTVESGTAVFYCFTLHNSGDITLTQHTVQDEVLGVQTNLSFDLGPLATVQITRSLISALGPVSITAPLTNTVIITSSDEISAPESSLRVAQVLASATATDTATVDTEAPTDLPATEQPEQGDNRLYLPMLH